MPQQVRLPRSLGDMAISAAPVGFVLLWSSGFIGARLGTPYAEPMTFLFLRMAAVVLLMIVVVALTRPPWPSRIGALHSIATGMLVYGCYLGGIFIALNRHLPTGIGALVVGLQPILTATLASRLLGERVAAHQWIGLLLGLVGIYLVVESKTVRGEASAVAWTAITVSLIGITAGTLYQKRFGAASTGVPGFSSNTALRVFPLTDPSTDSDLAGWKRDDLWRCHYGDLVDPALFFAEGLFGEQFGIRNEQIFSFDPETAPSPPSPRIWRAGRRSFCSTTMSWSGRSSLGNGRRRTEHFHPASGWHRRYPSSWAARSRWATSMPPTLSRRFASGGI